MARRPVKYTQVYSSCEQGKQVFYVRIASHETNRFPHGVALATTFDDKTKAEEFADDVDEYLDTIFKSLA